MTIIVGKKNLIENYYNVHVFGFNCRDGHYVTQLYQSCYLH